MSKRCPGCDETLELDAFGKRRGTPDGLQWRCKSCTQAYHAGWRAANPGQALRKFGLTEDEYQARLEAQGGVCAICGRSPEANRRLAVDHDHNTCVVRGLLCTHCNVGLGHLKDDPVVVTAALAYLETHRSAPNADLVTA